MYKNSFLLVSRVLFLLIFLSAPSYGKEVLNKIVAVVNGEMITLYDLDLQAAPAILNASLSADSPADLPKIDAIRRQVLDTMVIDILLKKEAERLKINVSDEEIQNEIAMMKERARIDKEEMQRKIAMHGLSDDILKDKIRRSILNQRLINMMILRKIVIPKEDIEKFYYNHSDAFVKDRSIDVQLIVFDKKSDSQEIVDKIKSGQLSFEEAAKQHSVGPHAQEGGRMGAIYWSELSKEWQEILGNLKPGVLSHIFDLDGLDAILMINRISPGQSLSLEEAAPEIEEYLKQPLIETRFNEYIGQLRNKAVIEIRY